jgi:hypothetical protein
MVGSADNRASRLSWRPGQKARRARSQHCVGAALQRNDLNASLSMTTRFGIEAGISAEISKPRARTRFARLSKDPGAIAALQPASWRGRRTHEDLHSLHRLAAEVCEYRPGRSWQRPRACDSGDVGAPCPSEADCRHQSVRFGLNATGTSGAHFPHPTLVEGIDAIGRTFTISGAPLIRRIPERRN